MNSLGVKALLNTVSEGLKNIFMKKNK